MCTWNTGVGAGRGCAGAFHVDESAQYSYCGLPNYQWTGSVMLKGSTDTFTLYADTKDSTTECHKPNAERFLMLR